MDRHGAQSAIRSPIDLASCCAAADRATASADLGMIEALGFQTRLQVLEESVEEPGAATHRVSLVYLSRAGLTPDDPALQRYASHSVRLGQPLIAICLDPDTAPAKNSGFRVPAILRFELSAENYQRTLYGMILDSLDQTGWNDSQIPDRSAATVILPSALVVSTNKGTRVIPRDFMGLVSVGRNLSCQICVDSTFASRLHGCFRTDGDRFLYRDMSTNGTVLYDGHEELLLHDEERELPAQGELRIGEFSLKLQINRP